MLRLLDVQCAMISDKSKELYFLMKESFMPKELLAGRMEESGA